MALNSKQAFYYMKLLLVNTNRYRTPPVPPLSLEYLESSVKVSGHECRILDLCFEDDPLAALDEEVGRYIPDVTGVTIRNIDTVIYDNNVFFLDEIRSIVHHLKEKEIPVVAGGVGFSFIPDGVLEYIGADWGVKGPGEKALVHVLDRCGSNPSHMGTIFNGWEFGFNPDMPVERGNSIDYARYIREGGLAGFQTQKGCREHCKYCSEGNGFVMFRSPEHIVDELKTLTEKGFTDFHLCDTEFNQDLEFCYKFLETLIGKGPRISWALYMKSHPYEENLFRLLRKSGAHLVTLSIPTGRNDLSDAAEIVRQAKKHDLRIAVDLLLGLPGDTVKTMKRSIDHMREIQPDTVGINATIRLYPDTAVARDVLKSKSLRKCQHGAVDNNPKLVHPVFYNHITVDMLREIIGDDPLFKIEGFERTSNYQRLNSSEHSSKNF